MKKTTSKTKKDVTKKSAPKKAKPAPMKAGGETIVARKPFRPESKGVTLKELDEQRKAIPKTKASNRYPNANEKKQKPLAQDKCFFLDAQDQSVNTSGYAPSESDLKSIKAGDSLKVGLNTGTATDYFWVTANKVDGNKVSGTVEHKLAHHEVHRCNIGSSVTFKKNNIFKISKN